MKIEEVRLRLDEIEHHKGDDERAHHLRDDLWCDVLASIAEGAEDARLLADVVLGSEDIEFSRWCA